MKLVTVEMPKKERIRRRKALLIERGISQASIAQKLGVRPHTVSMVMGEFNKTPRIRKAVAEALNLPYEKLWKKTA